MNRLVLLSFVALTVLTSGPVIAAESLTEVAVFEGSAVPSGWTVENGQYRSPGYANAVDRIELVYSGTDASASAVITAFPQQGGETGVATLTAASSGASFDFPETTDFRSFSIAAADGFALSSFAAYMSPSALEAPSGVAISNNITGTSFDAYWGAVEGAKGYKVYVWTNAVAGASEGTEVWKETFANAPETTSTSTTFKNSYTDSGTSEWDAEIVYAYSEAGTVRVGNTKNKGVLVSPPLPALSETTPLALRVTAWRQKTDDGRDMPLGIVSGDATNIVGVVALGDESAAYHVVLPALTAGDRIAIFSPTNKTSARAIIDDVAILSGYSEGSLAPDYIVNDLDVGTATSHSFADLPSVPVQFAVEAYGRRGVSSEKTEAVEVDLANPDKVAMLNACPLSSLEEGAYTQDFDSLAGADTNWLNGTTLQYWQAYRGDDAVAKITHNTGTGSSGGLYALAEDTKSDVRAFGGITTKTDLLTWGIAFTNDTNGPMVLSSVGYSAQQWGTRNAEAHNLTMSYLLTDSLKWMVDETGDWTECCSTAADGNKPVVPVLSDEAWNPEEPVAIAPGQILFLRWKVDPPANGSAAMMGIDDVTVTFGTVPLKGFFIHLADI